MSIYIYICIYIHDNIPYEYVAVTANDRFLPVNPGEVHQRDTCSKGDLERSVWGAQSIRAVGFYIWNMKTIGNYRKTIENPSFI